MTNEYEETEKVCLSLSKKLSDAFGIVLDVFYGEVPNLGKWYYLPRSKFDGYFRLGMFKNSASSFVDTMIKCPPLPDDIIKH